MNVFIVDDEQPNRDVFESMFQALGFIPRVFTDSRALLREYRTQGEQADLVFTDFQMPMMDGVTLACHLRSVNPKLPILMATGDPRMARSLNNDLGYPIRVILPKPFGLDELKQALVAAGVRNGTPDNGQGKPSTTEAK